MLQMPSSMMLNSQNMILQLFQIKLEGNGRIYSYCFIIAYGTDLSAEHNSRKYCKENSLKEHEN